MLHQNFKGLLTLVLIFSLLVGGFYLYKNVVEPQLINKNSIDQFPITEDIEIKPKIEVSSNKTTIEWDTPYNSVGAIMYCLKSNTNDCKEVANEEKSKSHKIELTGLKPQTAYSYKILIDEDYFPLDENSYFNFTTKSEVGVANDSSKKSPLQRPSITNTPSSTQTPPTKKVTLGEFKKALETQDLNYDIDKDGKVTTKDYNP